jgi:hypothetical protein
METIILKKDLQAWFNDRPAISVRQIGIEAGYVDGGRFRTWIKQKSKRNEAVSEPMMEKLSPVLKKYGYPIPD